MTYSSEEKLKFIANKVVHIAFNKAIVQLIVKDKWYTAYHAKPKEGNPFIHESKEAAMNDVIERAMADHA